MSQVINTNYLSLVAQNNLNKSQSSLNSAIERLSSGMRINSAKDDAAGQAIANRFTANIKGLTQASRNANDGISIAQTTEGALTEVNNNLQRVRELSVQAANGTNSQSDLDSIQDEITQRLDEINRVSDQTQFNGVKVLSASAGKLTVQVGANDGETIDIDLQEISASTLGLSGFNVNGGVGAANTAATAATAADLTTLGYTTTGVASGGFTTYTKATAGSTINNAAASAADVLGQVATNGTVTVGGRSYVKQAGGTYDYASAAGAVADAALTTALTPASGSTLSATVTIGGSAQNVVIDDTGNMTDASGNQLYIDATGNLSLNNAGSDPAADVSTVLTQMQATGAAGDSIKLTSGSDSGMNYAWAAAGTWTATQSLSAAAMATSAATSGAAVDLTGNASTDYNVAAGGAVTNAGAAAVYVDAIASGLTTSATSAQTTYENLYVDASGNVSDSNVDADADGVSDGKKQYLTAGALTSKAYVDSNGAATDDAFAKLAATTDPLKAIDAALSKVDKLRSSLGAVQNRFDSTIANLSTTITNLSSSRSRIEDADYAVEVSNMTRAQILQQAGTSVLAQANQTTQGVLSLLR